MKAFPSITLCAIHVTIRAGQLNLFLLNRAETATMLLTTPRTFSSTCSRVTGEFALCKFVRNF